MPIQEPTYWYLDNPNYIIIILENPWYPSLTKNAFEREIIFWNYDEVDDDHQSNNAEPTYEQ